jgi:AraC-like DNA-binding protein
LIYATLNDLALQNTREQHRTIGEITNRLGFSEPSNFSRAFRRWTGMSPAEFRESA